MNTDRDRATSADEGGDVASLLRLAGPPDDLPEPQVAPIRDAARAVWSRRVRRRTLRRRVWLAGSLAAALAAAVVLAPRSEPVAPPIPAPVASLARAVGTVAVQAATTPDAGARRLGPGAILATGSNGLASLTLANGGSLRVDGSSRVRLADAATVVLDRGAIYFDSGNRVASRVVVETPFGRVTDVGTRFEVRLVPADVARPDGLRIRVRDGEVRLTTAGEDVSASSGTELLLREGEGVRRGEAAVHGPEWRWTTLAAPMPAIEGRTLAEFLDWVTHEMGIGWNVVDPGAGPDPHEIVLHGSIAGLEPEEAIDMVLAGSALRPRRVGGELRIFAEGSERPAETDGR